MTEQQTNTMILPWHDTLWHKLSGRFPEIGHGLLFYGKQGCGKQQFAQQFAKWLLCANKQPQGACGQCKSCAWFVADTHPQLKKIQPDFDEKKQTYSAIKIDQIRELNEFIQQTVEGWRVVMIYRAEMMNIAAANALLKTLEEPGERVVLILISDAMLKLPATIRSRVQQFPLDRLSLQQAQQYLTAHLEVEPQLAGISLALAANMPLQAGQLYQSEWFKQRGSFLQAWQELVKYQNQPMKFSSYWFKQLDFKDLLQMLRYILQDCLSCKLQQPVKQTDLDISALAAHYSLQQLFAIYEQINKISTMLAQNVQTQLIFDQLTMQMMNVELIS